MNLYYREILDRVFSSKEMVWDSVRELENQWGKLVKDTSLECIAVNSGTAALQAIIQATLNPGDLVVVPGFTFTASALAILHANCIPVFCDVNEDDFTLDMNMLKDILGESDIKGVMAVDVDGYLPDYETLFALKEQYGFVLIEDACAAHGSFRNNRMAGTFGDHAAFSLNHTKIIPAGEGGMVATKNPEIAEKIRMLKDFGHPTSPQTHRSSFLAGYNWKMPYITAVAGLQGLECFETARACARKTKVVLDYGVNQCESLIALPDYLDGGLVIHKYRAKIASHVKRRVVEQALVNLDIPVLFSDVIYPLTNQKIFKDYSQRRLPVSEKVLVNTVVIGSRDQPPWRVKSEMVLGWSDKILNHLDSEIRRIIK